MRVMRQSDGVPTRFQIKFFFHYIVVVIVNQDLITRNIIGVLEYDAQIY